MTALAREKLVQRVPHRKTADEDAGDFSGEHRTRHTIGRQIEAETLMLEVVEVILPVHPVLVAESKCEAIGAQLMLGFENGGLVVANERSQPKRHATTIDQGFPRPTLIRPWHIPTDMKEQVEVGTL